MRKVEGRGGQEDGEGREEGREVGGLRRGFEEERGEAEGSGPTREGRRKVGGNRGPTQGGENCTRQFTHERAHSLLWLRSAF